MSTGHDDFESEPIRGLPKRLPPGEHILWQGAPNWWQLAKQAFHIRLAAIYLAVLMAWRAGVRISATGDGHAALAVIASLLPIALIGLGLLALLGWLYSRTTVYTITNRRLVMRTGVAFPVAINVPFAVMSAADLRIGAGGAGDIAIALSGCRLAYVNLWPHVRPWRFKNPEPTLRAIPDAGRVAEILSTALREFAPANLAETQAASFAENAVRPTLGPSAMRETPSGMPTSFGLSS
jgi:hypothetical protein